jgi:hypothetical protein
VASAERSERRRWPIELLVIGVACLVCCLPLLACIFVAASGVLARIGATMAGRRAGLAVAIAVLARAVALVIGWRMRRRIVRCATCGGTACAC